MATPQEPNALKRALHTISRGLLFSSSIKQFESSKESFEKQQVVNAFIDEHKPIVEQSLKSARTQESQLPFRKQLEQALKEKNVLEKFSRVKDTISKGENVRQF